jgi:hypothetical protein
LRERVQVRVAHGMSHSEHVAHVAAKEAGFARHQDQVAAQVVFGDIGQWGASHRDHSATGFVEARHRAQ